MGGRRERRGGLCRNLPGAGSQAAAWAVAGAAGPSAQRSQFRSGKPDEAGWGGAEPAPRGREVAQRVQPDPQAAGRDEERPRQAVEPRGGCRRSWAALRCLQATKSPPGPAPAGARGGPSPAPSARPCGWLRILPWGFGVRSRARGGGGGEEMQKYHLCQFFLKSYFFNLNTFKAKKKKNPSSGCQFQKLFTEEQRGGWARN